MHRADSRNRVGYPDEGGDSGQAWSFCVVSDLLRVRLLRRLRPVECIELHALIEHAHHRLIRAQVALVALRVEDLRHEAAIGHRWVVAVTKAASLLRAG